MSKLSRAIKHQRRQKAEKRRLRLEKKMRKCVLFSDTESEKETVDQNQNDCTEVDNIPRRKVINVNLSCASEPIPVLVEELSRNNGKAIVKFTLFPDL